MRTLCSILWIGCGLAALFFNTTNAVHLWGFLGGFFAVVAFPIVFFVVPVALLMQDEMPVYWLLLPAMGLFFYLAQRESEE